MINDDKVQSKTIKDIYLSHRDLNNDLASKLAADIESQMFGNRHITVWLDEAEIRPGQSIPGKVNEGLETSRFIGLVLTPEYFESKSGWTDAEWHSILHTDPDNRRSKIIPLLMKDCPYIPYLLCHLKMIDFRDNNYENALKELLIILRDEPLPRPVIVRGQIITSSNRIDRQTLMAERGIIQADPDAISERLYCNLLPVLKLPEYVFLASVKDELCKKRQDGTKIIPSKNELKELLREIQVKSGYEKTHIPAFRTFEEKIITFHDLEDSEGPLVPIIDYDRITSVASKQWIQNEDYRSIFVSLLNMAVTRHAHSAGLIPDESKQGRFYFPAKNKGEHKIRWKPRTKMATRTVAKPCTDQNGQLVFWRHQSVYLKVLYLINKFYLQLIPTWVFTHDGNKIMKGSNVSKLAIKWCGAERNLQVLFHVRFWTLVLRKSNKGLINIFAGDQILELDTEPAFISLPYGISSDQENLMQLLDNNATYIDSLDKLVGVEVIEDEKEQEDEQIAEDDIELMDVGESDVK